MIISKIDLSISQDWAPVIERFEYFRKLFSNLPEEKATFIPGFNTSRYDIGKYGSFTYYDTSIPIKKSGGVMAGTIVTKFLPWIDQLRHDLSGLNLAGVCFSGTATDVDAHIDGQESSNTNKHCKLNYIIDDYSDKTYAEDDKGNIESYPSHKDTAWLLDTTKNHWVAHNTRPRYVFQLSFHQDFDSVRDWFSNKGPLIYQ